MEPEPKRGPHTLRVLEGQIVGVHERDVFVDLGPRSQGVIAVERFDEPPTVGQRFEFTLRGREEGLWALELHETCVLDSWQRLEPGSWVPARVVRLCPGGLELKLGRLHGFMPRSEVGHESSLDELVGKTLSCEVLEVDAERQRATLSRKRVRKRERESERMRQAGSLRPGERVGGRVTRLEPYGAFVRLEGGAEGMVHVSNIAWEHTAHPQERLQLGQSVQAVVLAVRQSGRRIALGLKQTLSNPWETLDGAKLQGSVLEGEVRRVVDWGAFVSIAPGVEGLLHRSETGLSQERPLHSLLRCGEAISVRVLSLEVAAQRLSLSLLHESGRTLMRDEARNAREFAASAANQGQGNLKTSLGQLLRDALNGRASGETDAPTGATG